MGLNLKRNTSRSQRHHHHHHQKWGGAVATIEEEENSEVWGVLWKVSLNLWWCGSLAGDCFGLICTYLKVPHISTNSDSYDLDMNLLTLIFVSH